MEEKIKHLIAAFLHEKMVINIRIQNLSSIGLLDDETLNKLLDAKAELTGKIEKLEEILKRIKKGEYFFFKKRLKT